MLLDLLAMDEDCENADWSSVVVLLDFPYLEERKIIFLSNEPMEQIS